MDNVQVTMTICAGFDGGIIIYESTHDESRLVFGGDHKAATEYLSGRMARLIDDNAKQPGEGGEYDYAPTTPVVTKLPKRTVAATLADRLAQVTEN